MSIKEALEREPMNRPRTMLPPLTSEDSIIASQAIVEANFDLLKMSGAPVVLDELAGLIRPEFPGVSVVENRHVRDSSLSLVWNHRSDSLDPGQPSVPLVNMVKVAADSSIGNLTVSSGEGVEILTREQWSNPGVLEDAIAGHTGIHCVFLIILFRVAVKE